MLKIMNETDFDVIYNIMLESFPPDERRDYDGQRALLQNNAYRIYVMKDEVSDCIKAFIAIYDLDSLVFIEHFAVSSSYRNRGLGSVILKELTEIYDKPFCLEAEPPDDEISKRRIGFYERNGFFYNDYPYVQPPFSNDKNSVPLKIMTSGRTLSEREFTKIKSLLYQYVYHFSVLV